MFFDSTSLTTSISETIPDSKWVREAGKEISSTSAKADQSEGSFCVIDIFKGCKSKVQFSALYIEDIKNEWVETVV